LTDTVSRFANFQLSAVLVTDFRRVAVRGNLTRTKGGRTCLKICQYTFAEFLLKISNQNQGNVRHKFL